MHFWQREVDMNSFFFCYVYYQNYPFSMATYLRSPNFSQNPILPPNMRDFPLQFWGLRYLVSLVDMLQVGSSKVPETAEKDGIYKHYFWWMKMNFLAVFFHLFSELFRAYGENPNPDLLLMFLGCPLSSFFFCRN